MRWAAPVLIALVLVACQPEPPFRPVTPVPEVERMRLCRLLSAEAVGALVGQPVTASTERANGCAYITAGADLAVTISVEETNAISSSEVLMSAQASLFTRVPLEGIGDEAVWLPQVGALVGRKDLLVFTASGADENGLLTAPDLLVDVIVLLLEVYPEASLGVRFLVHPVEEQRQQQGYGNLN